MRGVRAWVALVAVPAGCAVPPAAPLRPASEPAVAAAAATRFAGVAARIEPQAVAACRARRPAHPSDFLLVVDARADAPPNAFQTLGPGGRPVILVTRALIEATANDDELAFVLAHEAAHHVAGHIPRQRQSALAGAIVAGALAAQSPGASPRSVRLAQEIGAAVGARRFSQDFELEADAIGTVIAWRAGYEPAAGAGFFMRIPDPGDRFLGTHPPNAARIRTVARVLSDLRAGPIARGSIDLDQ
jgi:predicted Zn-dependent protease